MDLIFAGDLVLDEPGPDHWLAGIAPALHGADVAIGHLEVPHTHSRVELQADVPAPGADPAHLAALPRAGFDAVSLAGNHIADCGSDGIADTLSALDDVGVAHTGAGMNLAEARLPAILRCGDMRVALLAYNCVGPQHAWASQSRPGCTYICIEPVGGGDITPTAQLERIDPQSLQAMRDDIARARFTADLVIVAFHKGIVHTRARLATYERPIAHAAIDAGCDIVLGHHAHIVRGIEVYRGKPIFHGLGNGCVVTRALSVDQNHPARAAWARRRQALFGFAPDPAYVLAPFHPEAVNSLLGRVRVQHGHLRVGFVPVDVEPPGRPVLAVGAARRRICDYVQAITIEAGLPQLNVEMTHDTVWLM